jgi:hypothetical protein
MGKRRRWLVPEIPAGSLDIGHDPGIGPIADDPLEQLGKELGGSGLDPLAVVRTDFGRERNARGDDDRPELESLAFGVGHWTPSGKFGAAAQTGMSQLERLVHRELGTTVAFGAGH